MASLLHRPKFAFADRFGKLGPLRKRERPIRIEESVEDDVYRVRAELPGFDPQKDIHVTTDHETLTISAERTSRKRGHGRSEFRYGSFTRSRTLPAGADTSKISAEYSNGVLDITVPRRGAQDSADVLIAKH